MQPNLNPWGDYLRFRRESPCAPYNIQSFTELGSADNDYSFLHRELYTKDSETKIVNALNKFLKLK